MTLQYVILMEILSAFRIYAISKDPTPNKVHRTLQVTFGRFSDFKWRTVYTIPIVLLCVSSIELCTISLD